MKALFLTHPEADYGGAYLWNGLNIVLGEGNVYDFPSKPYYHGTAATGVDIPEKGIINGSVCPPPWLPARPEHDFDVIDIREQLKAGFFDLVVIESPRIYAVQMFHLLKAFIPDMTKVILHDGEDYTGFFPPTDWEKPYIYLKRELLKQYSMDSWARDEEHPRVIAFPFSAPDNLAVGEPKPYQECEISVAAMFGGTWPARRTLCEALKGVPNAFVAHDADTMNHETGQHSLQPFDAYMETLRNSKFGVSMRGHGYDTCRFWEIAVTTGLLFDKLGIHIPHEIIPGVTGYGYDCPAQAARIARFIATDSGNYSAEVRDEGVAHAREHHTNSARVRWMLERVMN